MTTPDGVPPKEVTVAVNVTALPTDAGFGVAPRVVEVAASVTDWLTAALVLAAKFTVAP